MKSKIKLFEKSERSVKGVASRHWTLAAFCQMLSRDPLSNTIK